MKAASCRGDGSTLTPYPTLTATWLACEPPDLGSKAAQLLELAVGGDAIRQARYASDRVRKATSIAIEIVRKPAWQVGFCVHKRRWVVERCFAWLGRNRRLAKDFEASLASATAFLYAASVLFLKRSARSA